MLNGLLGKLFPYSQFHRKERDFEKGLLQKIAYMAKIPVNLISRHNKMHINYFHTGWVFPFYGHFRFWRVY